MNTLLRNSSINTLIGLLKLKIWRNAFNAVGLLNVLYTH